MSCHDIGHGMNAVSRTVLDLYEEGRIHKESAMRLIRACRKGVHWCDGSEPDACVETIIRGYCGLCFEKSITLTDILDNDLDYPECDRVFDPFDAVAAHRFLCPTCRDRVLEEYRVPLSAVDAYI